MLAPFFSPSRTLRLDRPSQHLSRDCCLKRYVATTAFDVFFDPWHLARMPWERQRGFEETVCIAFLDANSHHMGFGYHTFTLLGAAVNVLKACLVISNAIFIGVEVQHTLAHPKDASVVLQAFCSSAGCAHSAQITRTSSMSSYGRLAVLCWGHDVVIWYG